MLHPKNEDYLSTIENYTQGKMIDISIEAVGVQPTANESIKALKVGGTAVWVGMSKNAMDNLHTKPDKYIKIIIDPTK